MIRGWLTEHYAGIGGALLIHLFIWHRLQDDVKQVTLSPDFASLPTVVSVRFSPPSQSEAVVTEDIAPVIPEKELLAEEENLPEPPLQQEVEPPSEPPPEDISPEPAPQQETESPSELLPDPLPVTAPPAPPLLRKPAVPKVNTPRSSRSPAPKIFVPKNPKQKPPPSAPPAEPVRQVKALPLRSAVTAKTSVEPFAAVTPKAPPQPPSTPVVSEDMVKGKRTPPVYPKKALRRKQEGVVWIRVLISETGKRLDIELLKPSRHRLLNQAAIKSVKKWTFSPHIVRGQAVKSRVDIPIEFTLK